MIESFYRGKNILITGCTGFLGKVVLERILSTLSVIGKVFVIIRNKKGNSIDERFKKEILDSPCFDTLRSNLGPQFDEYIAEKTMPINGDMLQDNIGLSPEDLQLLSTDLNVIIHCAASIDFNQRLDLSMDINVFGAMRMLAVAQQCQNLDIYVHVSTAYVNCEKQGRIAEHVYPLGVDPQELIDKVMSTPVDQIEKVTPQILQKFPNTYTYTKRIGEHMLIKHKGDLPVAFVRPSIIGSSWRDPFPGWSDSVAAAGAFYLAIGLGVSTMGIGKLTNVGDQIPADFVANNCILAGAFQARNPEVQVVHACSSTRNPITWAMVHPIMLGYWNKYPPEKRVQKSKFKFYKTETQYNWAKFFRYEIAANLYMKYANLTGSATNIKNANLIQKLLSRQDTIAKTFKHFTSNEWFYETHYAIWVADQMTKEERDRWPVDITKVNWKAYIANFIYGLKKFILKEPATAPADVKSMDLNLDLISSNYMSDLQWAYQIKLLGNFRPVREMQSIVLNSASVQALIHDNKDRKQAEAIYKRLAADVRPPVAKAFAYSLRKIWRAIYDKVVIDEVALQKIKKLKSKGPICYIPTHRSYIDFLVLSYILLSYGIEIPYIAARDDFLQIVLVNHLMRMSGGFFIKKNISKDPIYFAIFSEYVKQLLRDHNSMEWFIEGTRSRTGKMLHPKTGMLSICTDVYFDQEIPDLFFAPVTINYERVMEGETYPMELLGEDKVRESLMRVIKTARILNQDFGKIYIQFAETMSLKDYVADKFPTLDPSHNRDHRDQVNNSLAYDITYALERNLVIMPTAVVSTTLLLNWRGISQDELINRCAWLTEEVRRAGGKVGGIQNAQDAVRAAMSHLPLVKQKNIFKVSVEPSTDYEHILLLAYYRNTLIHLFVDQSFVATSLVQFGHSMATKDGVPFNRLREEADFIATLLAHEFVTPKQPNYDVLINAGAIEITEDNKVKIITESKINFLCSLVWPYIDAYWVTAFFLQTLHSPLNQEQLQNQIQWFADNMFKERVITFNESCSIEMIRNALKTLITMGVIQRDENYEISLMAEYANDDKKFTAMVDQIDRFRNPYSSRTFDIRRAAVDMPILSKL